MTAENNRKYIAEAWIGNKEEEEFKKSYLNSLIRQWQGHLNGFDADTVDGFHKEDILKAIDDETKELLKSFYIGKTFFSKSNETIQYFLGFEGIKLYNIQAEDTGEGEEHHQADIDQRNGAATHGGQLQPEGNDVFKYGNDRRKCRKDHK